MNIIMTLLRRKMDLFIARFGYRLIIREDGSGSVDIINEEYLWYTYYDFDILAELEYWLTDFEV